MQKRRKCCKYQYLLDPRYTKHCKYQCFWKPSKKNTVNYSIFERVDRKKCWYSQCFCNFKKTWEARNTVNSSVLATFGRRNAGIYAVFYPWRRQTLVNYSIFFPFWTDFLRWWTQKTLVFTRFSKNRRSWRERNPVNNSVLATFGD